MLCYTLVACQLRTSTRRHPRAERFGSCPRTTLHQSLARDIRLESAYPLFMALTLVKTKCRRDRGFKESNASCNFLGWI